MLSFLKAQREVAQSVQLSYRYKLNVISNTEKQNL